MRCISNSYTSARDLFPTTKSLQASSKLSMDTNSSNVWLNKILDTPLSVPPPEFSASASGSETNVPVLV